ncbi:MAG: reverse transcriptase N-terminal domain-containing protein, partial [Bacteroidales bacterium]|nr:reverse transcriptase N-terminal domain-containing protein [Bacteroidales bacterium]
MSPVTAGCASETKWTNWHSINWKKVRRGVKSLQRRIVKAVETKHFHKAKVLLYLLARSFYGKLLAILRVTTNQGGIISPTIANMVLDGLEEEIYMKACPIVYSNGRRQ